MKDELHVWRVIITERADGSGISPAAALDSLERALQQLAAERRELEQRLEGRAATEAESARLASVAERIRRTRQQTDTVRACAALQRAEAASGSGPGQLQLTTARTAWRALHHTATPNARKRPRAKN